MFVIVAGGGRTGSQLAQVLLSGGHQVTVVEHRHEMLTRLHQELPTEAIYEGNVSDPSVLEQAGIRKANVIATCTSDDTVNLTLCFLARKMFNVPRTIARVNNPRNAWLFDEKFHVDVALNNAAIMASLIEEEMSFGDMVTLLKLRRGDYSLVEEKVPPTARAIGIALKDLGLVDSCVVAAIIRDGKVVVPRGMSEICAGDEILAIADRAGTEQLKSLFSAPEDGE